MSVCSLTEKQQYWLKHHNDYESFSGSLKDYAHTHDLNLTDLYSWRKILREKGLIPALPKIAKSTMASKFSRIQLDPSTGVSTSIRVRTQQVSISIHGLPEPQWLADLVKALDYQS